MNKVIYLGPDFAFEVVKKKLEKNFEVVHIKDEKSFLSTVKKASAILDASMKFKITNQLIKKSPYLQVISCATTGSDHIERTELDKRKIPVYTLKTEYDLLKNLTPAAELSWALLIACARNLKGALHHVAEGLWIREKFPGKMLNGSILGLIGCGRIGGWMAKYAHAFGMQVLAYDPYQKELPPNVKRCELEELVSKSDFVSVHVPLNETTKNMISREIIAKFKPGSVLINTSRGGVVDEKALLEALQSGHLSAAGLDVLSNEPEISQNPLVKYARENDNLLITPHCGGFSPDAVRLVCQRAAERILEVLDK